MPLYLYYRYNSCITYNVFFFLHSSVICLQQLVGTVLAFKYSAVGTIGRHKNNFLVTFETTVTFVTKK